LLVDSFNWSRVDILPHSEGILLFLLSWFYLCKLHFLVDHEHDSLRAYPYRKIHGGSAIDNIEYLVAVVVGSFLAGVERYRADNLVQLLVADQHPSHFFLGPEWAGSYLEKVRPQNCTCFSRMAIWGLGDEIFIYNQMEE